MRAHRTQRSVIIIASVFLTMMVFGLPALATAAESDTNNKSRPLLRETYDGPPGLPAQPVPGAPPALPVVFASYSSIQANVGPGGSNIVGDAANEPSIAVDPMRPNRIAIGWRQFATTLSSFREAGWAYSTDGGRTWTFPGVIEPGVFRSDPVLDADADGHFFYSSLRYQNPDYWCDVFKSWDGGQTWAHKSYAYGGDKQWITIDRTTGIGRGNIYQAWSVVAGCCSDTTFTRSVDAGINFQPPVTIPERPIWGTMAVGSGGELFVAGIDPNLTTRFWVAKSTNAFDPGQTPTFDFVTEVNMQGGISYGGGAGTPNPGGLLGQVNIAVDVSDGPNAGNVYLCASVSLGNDPLDIHFARSTDGGLTFGAPIRLNDDPYITEYQWFGTMSVAPNGRIDVIFNDTRNDRVPNLSALYYTSSSNGGATWSPNQQLSPVFDSYLGWPQQQKLGDYYDMVSDDVGAHVSWAATFNGEQDVYYLRIGDYDCNSNGVPDSLDIANGTSTDTDGNGIPDECDDLLSTAAEAGEHNGYQLYQNVPNPFNPSTVIRFDVPDGGGYVTLRVFDVAGRVVRTLVDGYQMGGVASVRWDGRNDGGGRVATGVYLYRLSAEGYTETRKLMLIK